MSNRAQYDAGPRRRRSDIPPREPWVSRFGWLIVFVVLVFLAGLVVGIFGGRISGNDTAGGPSAREPLRNGARAEIGGLGPRVGALEERAEEFDVQVARLRAAGNGALPARTDAIEAAIRRLELDTRTLPGLSRRLDASEGALARITALETRMAAAEAVPATVSSLTARLTAVEVAAQKLPEMAARIERTGGAADRVPDLVARLAQLETSLSVARATNAANADGAQPPPAPEDLLARLSSLDTRLDKLEDGGQTDSVFATLQVIDERLGILELGIGGSAAADDVAAIGSRVDKLESGIAEMARTAEIEAIGARIEPLERASAERALAGTAGAAVVADFEQRIAALENAPAGARRTAALVVALGQLRGAVSEGRPYAPELDGFQAIAASLDDGRLDSAITALGERADAGVSTLDGLRRRFSALAAGLVRAEALGTDPGWVDKTLDRLSSVVSVRRVGEIEGAGVEAKVARAEARLAEGDLDGAVADLTGLQGAALEVWLGDARARLAADRALAEMSERTAAHLKAS